ncbi:MAG: YceI family protein [Bacteroidetes bacterium]|nr:YceI family protein [Bacteroidota bacterium]
MKAFSVLIASLLFLAGNIASAQDYKADSKNTVIDWTGKKISGKHYGKITLKEGSFSISDNRISSGKFIIDMNSITCEDLTGGTAQKLVGHLKSDDFFSTGKYGVSTLEITSGEPFKNNEAVVTGKLTIKDITHPVTFTVKRTGTTYTSTVTVDRTLYNIRYGSGKFFQNLGDNMIDDNFTLDVRIQAIQ